MKRATFLSTVAITAAIWGETGEAFAQCVATTDCASLGYTETSCPNGGLKCPFGDTWSCKENTSTSTTPEPPTTATLGTCTGYAANCTIGQILNTDGSCTSDVTSGKVPLGVVVAIKDNCGYAMTASPIQTGIIWGGYGTDIPSLPNYTSYTTAIRDFDVSGNMTKIIQAGNANTYPAAYAALNYAPSAAPTSKGKWALPTAGILNSLYKNLNAINNTIYKLGGTQLKGDNEHIWSSSEYSYHNAWIFCTGPSDGVDAYLKDDANNGTAPHVVRPVLPF